jgi:hypothetical protein
VVVTAFQQGFIGDRALGLIFEGAKFTCLRVKKPYNQPGKYGNSRVKKGINMGNTRLMLSICLFAAALFFYSSCAPEAEIAVRPEPGQTVRYKTVTEVRKFYKFTQPSEKKVTEKNTTSIIEWVYDQTITDVDEQGNTTADITIKRLSYLTSTSEGAGEDFDSSRDSDKGKPFAKLVGQSYTIKTSADGKVVEVLGAQTAPSTIKGRQGGQAGGYLLSEDAIKERHSIGYLPPSGKSKISVGDTWESVEASPKGMLTPKSYEKVFKVKDISSSDSGKIATITMKAIPTSKEAEGVSEQAVTGMKFFTDMFDTGETFQGELVINLNSGQIIRYNETLVSESTAADMPRRAAPDAEPDVLNLKFDRRCSMERID